MALRGHFPYRIHNKYFYGKCPLLVLAAGLGIALISFYLLTHQGKKLFRQEELLMGTFVEVVSPEARAGRIVFSEMRRIEGLLSRYLAESEIAQLNRNGYLKASPETFYIIKRSREFWQESNGAFDITIAPLLDLWGFTHKQFRVPEKAEINNTLLLVGTDKIILQDKDNVIQFKFPGMKIDLGAIAKGYALDCSVQKLKEAGIQSCLINAGGQVYCLGNWNLKPWKTGLINPRGKNLTANLELKNKSAATSGDYEQYFIKDRKRYSHILDPKTGYPADAGIISVTVTANDGLTADALSTAVFVLGRDKGEELVKKYRGAEVKIIDEQYD